MPLLGANGQPIAFPTQGAMPAADDMTKTMDVLDSEVIQIEGVMNRIRERTMQELGSANDFTREIKQRFEDIGWVVEVRWWYTNEDQVYLPEITMVARTEAKPFDREQMTHEVVNDVLELGEGGVISTGGGDPEVMRRLSEGHKH